MIAKKNTYYTSRKILVTYFVVFVLIPYILLSGFQIMVYMNSVIREHVKAGREVVEQINLTVEKQVDRAENFITLLITSEEYKEFQRGKYQEEYGYPLYERYSALAKLIQNNTREDFNIKSVVIINSHNSVYTYGKTNCIDFDIVKRSEWYDEAIEANGKVCWFVKRDGDEESAPIGILAAKKIYDIQTMQETGVIAVEVMTKFFDISLPAEGDNSFLYVADANRKPLFVLQGEYDRVFLEELTEKIMSGNYQENELCRVDETRYIPIVSEKSDKGWRVIKAIPLNQLINSVIGVCLLIGAILLCCFALFFGMFLVVYRRIAQPMQYLIGLINEIKADPEVQIDLGKYPCYEAMQISSEIVNLSKENETVQEELNAVSYAKNEIELDKLQAQINPHYIYNTLTAVKYMALRNHQQEISDMITALVKTLRSTVNRDGQYITVAQEIDNLQQYIYIQRILSKDQINFELDVDSAAEKYYIPNFILQPLVENAIIHGLNPRGCTGTVKVLVREQGDRMRIEVRDDGVGIDMSKISEMNSTHTKGIGISNIALPGVIKKIELLYKGKGSFRIEPVLEGGTRVEILLPLMFED